MSGCSVDSSSLVERLRALEREKRALMEENGHQRRRYEQCLSDVTNHVMHVLLAQKSVRSECLQLQQRVQQLERQNHRLQLLVQHTFSSLTYSTLQALNQAAQLSSRDDHRLHPTNAASEPVTSASSAMLNSIASESSTIAAGSASGDYGNSSSDGGHSSTASTALASSTSFLGASAHSDGTGWFWHPSTQLVKSPSPLPSGFIAEPSPATSPPGTRCHRTARHSLADRSGAEGCSEGLTRDEQSKVDGGGYVRTSDLDEDVTELVCSAGTPPSPTGKLLSLSDLFCRKFTAVESRRQGRMLLVQPGRTVEMDSESDDMMTSARESRRSVHRSRAATASTVSLNDLLDGDSGSSDPSTPEGCDNLSISDYEQLVVEGHANVPADDASTLPPPPLSLLTNGCSPLTTQPAYLFIPVMDDERHVDSSTDSSDYTNLADDESLPSGSQRRGASCATSSGYKLPASVSGKLVNGTGHRDASFCDNSISYQQDTLAERSRGADNHVPTAGPVSGLHRPTVLLTRRRKRASLAASAIVQNIRRNVDFQPANDASGSWPQPRSNGHGPGMVVLFKDCLDRNGVGSSDECPSVESLDRLAFRSVDGTDTVLNEKPLASQDDGYCTAKSGLAALPRTRSQHLSKITSSAEDVFDLFVNSLSPHNEKPDTVDSQPLQDNERLVNGQLKNSNDDFFGLLESDDMVDSSDPETNLEKRTVSTLQACHGASFQKHFALPSSLNSGDSKNSVVSLGMVENRANGLSGDSSANSPARREVDGDVRRAIDSFAFLDDPQSSANAASRISQ